jgi:hypothetical protein
MNIFKSKEDKKEIDTPEPEPGFYYPKNQNLESPPSVNLEKEIENEKSSLIKYIVIGTTVILITSFGYVY